MRERILTAVLIVGLGSFACGAEIRRPTTWTVSGSVTNAAGATDADDTSTYATVDGSNGTATIDYKGFPAASASYARLQLHVISSCDETNGDTCSVQVSFDNGSSWMPIYGGIAMGNGPNAPFDSSIDLEPTFNPSTVVVRVAADYSYDPGGCQDPDCIDYIPPSWYWGVAQVYGVYTAGTFGTPVAYTIRGSASGVDPNGDSSLCRYPGTLKHSTWYLPYSYDSDPNSSSYVYGTGGGNSSYAGTGSWVGGFNKPEPLGYMRLVMTVSCTASRQYWSLCDYAFTLDHGNSWYWAVETGDGGGGTFSIILPPNADLSNFFVGVCAKAQYSGWSYAYLSDARIESYSQQGTPPPPFGWMDFAVDASDGDSTVTEYGTVNVGGWAADANTGAPVSRVEVRVDGSTVGNATLGGTRQDVANAYSRSDYLYSGWNYSLSVGAMPAGTHTLTAVAFAPDGLLATLSGSKTITVTPVISAVSPAEAQTEDLVEISGAAFGGAQGSSTILLNGQVLNSIVFWSDSRVVVQLPDNSAGGPIQVTVNGLTSNSMGLSVNQPSTAVGACSQ